jgi:hypothetical protein
MRPAVIQSIAASVSCKLKHRLNTCMSVLIKNPLQQNGCKWCIIILPACCEWISHTGQLCSKHIWYLWWFMHGYQQCVTLGEHFKDGNEAVTTGYFQSRKETVNEVHYMHMLQKLLFAICDKHPMKRHTVQHDNAHHHTACLTSGKIERFGWEVLPHSPFGSFRLSPLLGLKRLHERTTLIQLQST